MEKSARSSSLRRGEEKAASGGSTRDHGFIALQTDDEVKEEEELELQEFELLQPSRFWLRTCLRWTKYSIFLVLVIGAVGGGMVYGFPFILEKVVVPLMGWEAQNLSKPLLAILSTLSLAIFPVFLIPTGPSLWLIGVMFGYLWGFLLTFFGSALGSTLPFIVGRWLLHKRVQEWLARHPKNAALLRIAEQGGWFHQFRVVVLLRLSPFPYGPLNYAISATKIGYGPYICATLLNLVPETLLAIYCGRLVKTLADYHQEKKRRLTPLEMVSQGVGLCTAVVVSVLAMIYGRKALKELEMEEAAARDMASIEMITQREPAAPFRRALNWNDRELATAHIVEKRRHATDIDRSSSDHYEVAWIAPSSRKHVPLSGGDVLSPSHIVLLSSPANHGTEFDEPSKLVGGGYSALAGNEYGSPTHHSGSSEVREKEQNRVADGRQQIKSPTASRRSRQLPASSVRS